MDNSIITISKYHFSFVYLLKCGWHCSKRNWYNYFSNICNHVIIVHPYVAPSLCKGEGVGGHSGISKVFMFMLPLFWKEGAGGETGA